MRIQISFSVDEGISVVDREVIVSELRKAWHDSRVASWDWDCEVKL